MNQYEAITDIKQRQIKFLNDTVAHYRLDNRSTSVGGMRCLYLAKDDSTEGCAIGRHLPKDLAMRMDDRLFGNPGDWNNEILFNELPSWMKEMGRNFLIEIQSLHDNNICWTENGLSGAGLRQVDTLKVQFELNVNTLN